MIIPFLPLKGSAITDVQLSSGCPTQNMGYALCIRHRYRQAINGFLTIRNGNHR